MDGQAQSICRCTVAVSRRSSQIESGMVISEHIILRHIHGRAIEHNAAPLKVIQPARGAGVAQHVMPAAGISYRQLTSTTVAWQESC